LGTRFRWVLNLSRLEWFSLNFWRGRAEGIGVGSCWFAVWAVVVCCIVVCTDGGSVFGIEFGLGIMELMMGLYGGKWIGWRSGLLVLQYRRLKLGPLIGI